ncbi:MAG: D-tyrosyl-tRNA(Tyr) deacylase [Candidatus Zixiibacteriota bacterium]|nr:MAG: D-tyrosyl-tRNA(Tyr) deacylase [candidate division Zixibacteria bacterium]
MRAVLQRVTHGSVQIENRTRSAIGNGMVVLLGVMKDDAEQDADYLAKKIIELRIFEDADGKMNLSIRDRGGAILVVSQFTLCADCGKGRRPSFDNAAPPEQARKLYEYFTSKLKEQEDISVKTGVFQAEMLVHIDNDGPVTIILDSRPAVAGDRSE